MYELYKFINYKNNQRGTTLSILIHNLEWTLNLTILFHFLRKFSSMYHHCAFHLNLHIYGNLWIKSLTNWLKARFKRRILTSVECNSHLVDPYKEIRQLMSGVEFNRVAFNSWPCFMVFRKKCGWLLVYTKETSKVERSWSNSLENWLFSITKW